MQNAVILPFPMLPGRPAQDSQLDHFFWEFENNEFVLKLEVIVDGDVWFDLVMGHVNKNAETGKYAWRVGKDAIQFHGMAPYNSGRIYEEANDAMCCAFEHITADFA